MARTIALSSVFGSGLVDVLIDVRWDGWRRIEPLDDRRQGGRRRYHGGHPYDDEVGAHGNGLGFGAVDVTEPLLIDPGDVLDVVVAPGRRTDDRVDIAAGVVLQPQRIFDIHGRPVCPYGVLADAIVGQVVVQHQVLIPDRLALHAVVGAVGVGELGAR